MEERKWFTTAMAADYLGITVRALQAHVARGHIKPDRPGGKGSSRAHRYSIETLDGFGRRGKAA